MALVLFIAEERKEDIRLLVAPSHLGDSDSTQGEQGKVLTAKSR